MSDADLVGAPLGLDGADGIDRVAEYPFRAGGYALSLFSRALNGLVLRALADGPLRLAELRRRVGGPAQTTLRGNLENLFDGGVLEKRQSPHANTVDNALTPLGSELLRVSDALDAWLTLAPDGPLLLESDGGKVAIKALVNGWESTMLRALAARPLSLTELDNLISAFSYPALERRLAAMRLSGLVVAAKGGGGGTPYAAGEWLRLAMAPLLAAVRCERRHLPTVTAPLTRLDVETILLLALPLAAPPAGADGVAQLAVRGGDDSGWRSAGVRVTVGDGELRGCTSKLGPRTESRIAGSAMEWLDALVDGSVGRLEACGDRTITAELVESLHRTLFGGSGEPGARIGAAHGSVRA